MKSYIYKITNKVDGKIYIGFTDDLLTRWKKHIQDSKKKIHQHQVLYRAMNFHGIQNFIMEEIYCELNDPSYCLRVMEPYFVKLYDSIVPNGYNMTEGGVGMTGYTHREDTKERMSETRQGENNGFYGKTHSDDFKKKQSNNLKIRRPTMVGEKAPFYGKTHSDEYKNRLRNELSQQWEITYPDGKIIEVWNLKEFCKQNNLRYTNMVSVASGRDKSFKKFKCRKIEKPENF